MRRLRTKAARAALARAERAAREAGIPALMAEVESASLRPEHARGAPDCARRGAARSCSRRSKRCWRRRRSSWTRAAMSCAAQTRWSRSQRVRCCSRSHARSAEAWPGDVSRDALLARAFRAKHADESHRARLRVEIGRLRAALRTLAERERDDSEGLRWRRAARARSSCWRRPSKSSMRRCSPSSPTASRGRARRWRSRSAPASAPCSGRSMSLRQQARCSRSAAARARRWMTAARAGIHDNLVTPGSAAERLGCEHPKQQTEVKHETHQQPKSSASMAPFPASTRCMASRSTASTSGLRPATS